jgi:hypothetical protein
MGREAWMVLAGKVSREIKAACSPFETAGLAFRDFKLFNLAPILLYHCYQLIYFAGV